MDWGLLGGERLEGTRRTRALGMGATVRVFNELAVPGLGGVWFGKQVMLALLGIYLAETARGNGAGPSNIMAANAVEALAVWLTLKKDGWIRDARLRGVLKLQRYGADQDPTFNVARSQAFYVTQPMRIGTLDALAMLGFVEAKSRRFNSYTMSKLGSAFLDAACPTACRLLMPWVHGGSLPVRRRSIVDDLAPTLPLTDRAREILCQAFLSGADPDRLRRQQALAWVEALHAHGTGHSDWNKKPAEIADAIHWADMHAGAALSHVLDAAAGEVDGGSVLGLIEARMGAAGVKKLTLAEAADITLEPSLRMLRDRARVFLDAGHDPSPGRAATRLCQECIQSNVIAVISRLTARDDRILRLSDDAILAGPAFKGQPIWAGAPDLRGGDQTDEQLSDEAPPDFGPALPEGISSRIRNLAALSPDLRVTAVVAAGS